jgi:5'-nucleotidase/UDP-sugar diphosphatase
MTGSVKLSKRLDSRPPLLVVLILLWTVASGAARAATVHMTLLQLNDVYESISLYNGAVGGLARVATLRKQLLQANPHTYTIFAGDLFSPSALTPVLINGEPLAGLHMVAAMDQLGLDYATFGNHEFDLEKSQFYARLAESRFTWLSSNYFDTAYKPFPGVPPHVIIDVQDQEGTPVKVGLFGVTMPLDEYVFPWEPYFTSTDVMRAVEQQVNALQAQVDILIAVTHLPLEQDIQIAEHFPAVDLIVGGHEHENIQVRRGRDYTPICKADANARTVCIRELRYNTVTRHLDIASHIQPITADIPADPATLAVIEAWQSQAWASLRRMGFEPERVVTHTTQPLDGLEAHVRRQRTNLTALLARGMLRAFPDTELSIFNGGAIRIDDVLPPGDVTEYDVMRILPYGGKAVSVKIKGRLLQRVLAQGRANRGSGGYLHTANVRGIDPGTWLINDKLLNQHRFYRVAINDFLLSGNEEGLGFLNRQSKEIIMQQAPEQADMRRLLIEQLRRAFK